MASVNQKLGYRIRELRMKRGVTQEELAEEIDLTPQYLSRLEVGKQSASVDTLVRLAEVLGVELWELFDFGHHAPPTELRGALRKLMQDADEEQLRMVLRVVQAVLR